MNRADRVRLLAAVEAIAGAVRQELKAEAAEEHERNGMTASWTAEGVTVSGSQSHDHHEVTDNDELMAYLVAEHPEMIMTIVVPRNPEHLKTWLAQQAAQGPIASMTEKLKPGESAPLAAAIPGVVFVRGGVFNTVSVKVDGSVKRELSARAKEALKEGLDSSRELSWLFRRALLELEEGEAG